MSYSPDITLDGQTYSLTSQRTNSSVRSDATQPVSEPNLLTISHENAKNGRRSSVIVLDDTKIVSTEGAAIPVADTVRSMFKIQFNPLGGRLDNETAINDQVKQIVAFFISDMTGVTLNTSNIAKMLNQES